MGEMEDQELSTATCSPFHLVPTRKPLLASGEPLSSKRKEWGSSCRPALYTSIPPKQFKTNRRKCHYLRRPENGTQESSRHQAGSP